MKKYAISIQQPWAYAILHAGKDVENRTWPFPGNIELPVRLVIHAGLKIDVDAYDFLESMGVTAPLSLPTGCLLGEVDITKCLSKAECYSRWAFGPWCWLLRNVEVYEKPIRYSGRLGIFEVEVEDGKSVPEVQ